jgi:DNA-directed RNA polymerase subunit omega
MVEKSLYRRNAFDRCFRQVGNKYAMVNIISKRSLDLSNGSAPMLETPSKNFQIIAAEEVAMGKLRVIPRRKHQDDDEDVA